MKMRLIISLLVIFVLAACAPAPAAPPAQPADTATPSAPPADTSTPLPSLTPTITPTPSPTPSYFVRDGTPVPQPAEAISPENVSQIAELARWGYGAIEEVLYGYQGKVMLVRTPIALYAYRTGSLDELWRVYAGSTFTDVSVSNREDLIAVGTFTGAVHLLNVQNGEEVSKWHAHQGELLAVNFSRDDQVLVTTGADLFVRLWQVETQTKQLEFKTDGEVYSPEFMQTQNWLALRIYYGGNENDYRFLDLSKNELVGPQIKAGYTLAIAPELDLYVYAYGGEFQLRKFTTDEKVIDLETREELFYGWGFFDSDFSIDGRHFATGLDNTNIALWDLDTGALVGIFDVKNGGAVTLGQRGKPVERSGPGPWALYSLNFSNDATKIVASNGAGDTYLWDVDKHIPVYSISGLGRRTFFSPNDTILISTSTDSLDIYEVATGKRLDYISGDWQYRELVYSPSGYYLALGANFWNTSSGEQMAVPYREIPLSFSKDDKYLYSIFPEWWVRQRSMNDLDLIQQRELQFPVEEDQYWDDYVPGQWYEMGGWNISPDHSLIHASAFELPVLSWNVDSGEYAGATGGSPASIVAYSPDNKYFVNHGSATEHFGIYSVEGGLPVYKFSIPFEDGFAYTVSISQDSKLLLVGANEKAYAYDLESGEELFSKALSDQNNPVRAVDTTPGNKVLVASVKHLIYFYDFLSGALIGTVESNFSGHSVEHLAFSPDGRYLATASSDGTVRLWGLPPN